MDNYISKDNNLVNVKEAFNRGNIFDNLYWPYKYIANIKPKTEKEILMTKIQIYGFAATEMNLYLDLYPNDLEAIGLFNQYKDEENRLIMEYENKYGYITLDINENYTWDWVKSPWPWERG